MIMKKTKKAFTIPELLIFLTIVGVISVMMFTIIKPNEKYLKYAYYNAYYVLATAGYNIKEDAYDIASTDETGTADVKDKYFPGTENSGLSGDDAAKELCKKLALDPKATGEAESKYGYLNTTVYNCSGNFKTVAKSGADSEFVDSKMAFRATNSMRFFISPLQSFSVADALTGGNVEIKYYIIWVDLNGDRLPNTAKWKESKPADIVPFVMTTSGTVLPVGYPTVDARYTTARIQFSQSGRLNYSPQSYPYLDAQIATYGGNEYPSHDLFSLNSSLREEMKGTAAEVKGYTPSVTTADDECKVASASEPPLCTLVLDENKK